MPDRRSRAVAVGLVAVGALASGAASVAGLALATRVLGPGRVGPLAVAWALAVVVGPGLWSSVEQEAARATATGEGTVAVLRLVRRRAVLAASMVAVVGLATRHLFFGGSIVVPLALAAVGAGYGPLHLAWGRLAGEGRSRALAASVAAEGLARLVLVGATAAVTHDVGASAAALAGAVALAAAIALRKTPRAREPARLPANPTTDRQAAADVRLRASTGSGLLSQGLFLTSPAIFELLAPPGDPRTARLAMAVLLARAPALAWKGVLAVVVPAVAGDPDAGHRASAAVARTAVIVAVVAGAAGSVVAVVAGDPVLDLLTGPGPELGPGALALLAGSTAAYLGALTVTAALAGTARARTASAAWLAGVAGSMGAVAIPGDILRRVVTSLAAGTAIAFAGLVLACLRRRPEPPDP